MFFSSVTVNILAAICHSLFLFCLFIVSVFWQARKMNGARFVWSNLLYSVALFLLLLFMLHLCPQFTITFFAFPRVVGLVLYTINRDTCRIVMFLPYLLRFCLSVCVFVMHRFCTQIQFAALQLAATVCGVMMFDLASINKRI